MTGERGHYRAKWRQMSQAMVAAAADPALDPDVLNPLAIDQRTNRWPSWRADKDAIMLSAAAGAMAAAYCYAGSIKRRAHLSDALRTVGAALGDMLDRTEPQPEAEPERRPLKLWYADQQGED